MNLQYIHYSPKSSYLFIVKIDGEHFYEHHSMHRYYFDQFGSKNNILIPRLLSNVMIARTVLAMFVISQLKPVNTPSAFFVMTKISKTHHLWPTFKKTILD